MTEKKYTYNPQTLSYDEYRLSYVQSSPDGCFALRRYFHGL